MLITGANRGIGLEHTRQYLGQGWRVIACARNPDAASLKALGASERLRRMALDVTDHGAISALASKLGDEPIDVLLNNAGTFGPQGAPEGMAYQSLENMDYGIWRQILEVNLLSPFAVAVALQAQLRRAQRPLLVMLASGLGSITDNQSGNAYAYRSSKAGLNMLMRGMAAEWKDIICVSMAPGWCDTELGGDGAPVKTVESVQAQQAVFAQLTLADSGRCIDRFGENVPW